MRDYEVARIMDLSDKEVAERNLGHGADPEIFSIAHQRKLIEANLQLEKERKAELRK
ncbi:hypothetical protein MMC32_006602 [Xylographa parallela]|nr:hypothetical protein [Xylographa parallela]